jgi:hypothetical protein
METDVVKRLWIPKNEFFFKKVHFGIKRLTPFKNAKYNALDCLKQEAGQRDTECPICAFIESLWEKYNALKSKEEKKKLLEQINQIEAQYCYTNAIDIDDEAEEFSAIYFTPSRVMEIDKIAEKYGIQNIIWLYKKIEKNKKVSYSLVESFDKEVTADLVSRSEMLMERSYEDGGLVDLERAYGRQQTLKQYLELLGETGDSDDEEDVQEPPSHDEPPAKKSVPKKKEEKIEIEVEDSDISLEEIEEAPKKKAEPPKKKAEPPKKQETSDLDIDDLSLESLDDSDLDLEDVEEETVTISADEINEKKKDQPWILKIYQHCLANGDIEKKDAYIDQIRTIYAFAKKNNGITMPSKLFA